MNDAPNPLSCGVVIVRRSESGIRYLLLRAYQYWDFPKGLMEQGEEPLAAAVREVEEETTLVGLEFRWGYDFRETPPYGKLRKVARYYIAESQVGDIMLPVTEELGHPEHEEYRWMAFDEAQTLVSARVQPVLSWARGVVESST